MYKLLLIIVLILCDLLSKQIIFYSIDLNNFIYINPFLELVHIHNFGISFGLFAGILPAWFFICIGCIIILVLCIFYLKSKDSLEKWGYCYILAGAFGNILDRIFNGYVIDFIYFHYQDFYWPAFNFADIYITLGVCMILLQIFRDLIKR